MDAGNDAITYGCKDKDAGELTNFKGINPRLCGGDEHMFLHCWIQCASHYVINFSADQRSIEAGQGISRDMGRNFVRIKPVQTRKDVFLPMSILMSDCRKNLSETSKIWVTFSDRTNKTIFQISSNHTIACHCPTGSKIHWTPAKKPVSMTYQAWNV